MLVTRLTVDFVHVDGFRDITQGQGSHGGDAFAEEGRPAVSTISLAVLRMVFCRWSIARISQSASPSCSFEPCTRSLVARACLQLEIILAIDDQTRQAGLVEPDLPAARLALCNQNIGHDRAFATAAIPAPGFRIVAAQFGKHFGKVFIVDIA